MTMPVITRYASARICQATSAWAHKVYARAGVCSAVRRIGPHSTRARNRITSGTVRVASGSKTLSGNEPA